MQDLNSNLFEFNSNGLNQNKVLEVSKNVWIFGGAPENDERNYGQGWRPRIEITMAWDILQVCYGDFQIKEIFNIAP